MQLFDVAKCEYSPTANAKTGQAYVNSLNDNREVWLNGQKVRPVTHQAFKGIITELSRIYDLQYHKEYMDQMTCVTEAGKRISLSYFLPKNREDLLKKKTNVEIWMKESWGQLPRAPDFMSNIVVGLYDYRYCLNKVNSLFYDNVINYYHYCAENDIALTHAIGDPQIDRSATLKDNPDLALRVIKKTDAGIVVRGAKQLATLAPVSNEVLVYLSPTFALRELPEYVLWFALPIDTPGLKVLCRESHSINVEGHSHYFASRYDEQDAMLFFEDVLVPWNRVFLLEDADVAFKGFFRINAWALYSNAIRSHMRLRTFIAMAILMAKSIGVDEFRNIQESIGELVSYAEMMRLSILGMAVEGRVTDGGLFAPSDATAPGVFAAQISHRVVEIIREIGGAGLVMQASEADLSHPEIGPWIDQYMRGKNTPASIKARIFRLAWELVGDRYGMRQELYEKWNRGDISRNRISLFKNYKIADIIERINNITQQAID